LTFNAIHVEGARNVAQQAAERGIERLIHMSGIGADASSASPYVRSRAEGEAQVMAVFPQATLLRPSAIFGPGDALLTVLIRLVRFVPVIPLFGQGSVYLQPVFVEDVAAAVLSALKDPGSAGRTYELGGPKAYSYKELVALVVQQLNKKRLFLPIPFFLWELQTRLLSLLPEPPLTSDQLALLKQDNIVSGRTPTLHDLGITPTSVESKLPDYI
jgi:NADH dehydrogenase